MSIDPKKRDRKNPLEGTEMDGLGKYMNRHRDAVRAERIQQTDQRIAEFAAQPKTLEWARKALVFCDREEASGKDIAEDSVGVQDLPRIRAEAQEIIDDAERAEAERKRKAAEAAAEAARKAAEAEAERKRKAAEDARRAAEAKAEAERRAAEAKAEAARRAAEAKAEAERRAAEAKAEAARKAEEARLAAARKAEEDRKAAIAAKEAQIRDTDALIAQLVSAPRSRFWCDEVLDAEKKIKALPGDVKLKLKNLPRLDDLVKEANAVREATSIDARIIELKRMSSHTPVWANKVVYLAREINDENRPYIKEIASFDRYLAESQKILRQPQINIVKQALTRLESWSVTAQTAKMRATYDETASGVLNQIDYDMGEYIDRFATRWQAIGQKIEAEEIRQENAAAEERRREAEAKKEREKREREEKRAREEREREERRIREAAEREERRRREEEERIKAAEAAARQRREAEERRRREEARRRRERRIARLKVTGVVIGILLVIGALIGSIALFEGARHWIINILITVVFTALMLWWRTASEAATWVHLSASICLSIASVPLLCFDGLFFMYGFGAALTVFVSSVVLLFYQTADDGWGRGGDSGLYYCPYLFTMFGGVLFAVAFGLLFDGVAAGLTIAIGFVAVYLLLTFAFYAAGDYYYDDEVPYMMVFFDIAFLIAALVFVWLDLAFSIIAIGICVGVFVRALFSWIFSGEAEKGWTLFIAAAILIIGVLAMFFMHGLDEAGHEPWEIENGVLIGYYGTEETVVIPAEVTVIGEGAFAHYGPQHNMKFIEMHDGIKSIGAGAFEDCDKLRVVEIPAKVTVIEAETFNECDSLWKVVFHDNVTKIGNSAFYECGNLYNIVLPRNLEEICFNAFNYAPLTGNVVMYNNVKTIDGNAFGTNVVTNITFHGTQSEWNAIEKDESWLSHWAWNDDSYKVTFHSAYADCDCADINND